MSESELIPEISKSLNESEIEVLKEMCLPKSSPPELLTPFDIFRLTDPDLLNRVHPRSVYMEFIYPERNYWSTELKISFTTPEHWVVYDVEESRSSELAMRKIPVEAWTDRTGSKFQWIINGCTIKMYRCTVKLSDEGVFSVSNSNCRRDSYCSVSAIQIRRIHDIFISIAKKIIGSDTRKYKEVLLKYNCVRTMLISKELEASRVELKGHTKTLYDFTDRIKKSLINLER